MTDIDTLQRQKIVSVLDTLSNTVALLVERVKEIEDERLIHRIYDVEQDVRELRRSVDRFDIR